jgi:hypothetical protein
MPPNRPALESSLAPTLSEDRRGSPTTENQFHRRQNPIFFTRGLWRVETRRSNDPQPNSALSFLRALLSRINHALPLQLSIHNSPNMPNCRAAQSQRTVSLMSPGKKNHISSSFSLSVSSTSMNHNFLPVPWHHRILDHHPGRPSPVESGLPSRNGGNRTKCKARHT